MKRKIRFIILTIIVIFILINSNIVIESVNQSFNIFYEKIFLSLFPFLVLSEILINYNYPYYLGRIFGKVFNKLFRISSSSIFVIFLSVLTGHPTNAFYIKELLDNNTLSLEEAENLLIYTYFPNPMFIIGTIGFTLYNNINLGLIILGILYINNIILAFILRNKNFEFNKSNIILKSPKPLLDVIKSSLYSSIKSLILVLGNITIFVIIVNLFNKYLSFSPLINTLVSMLLEITNGTLNVSNLNMDFNIKFALTIFTLIFSGFCIHTQVISILSNYKMNYKKLLITRFLSALIVSIICYLVL